MVVRMRHTRSHTANRRSHHALTAPALSVCSNCGAKHRPHHMCLACGFYKGKLVIDMAAKRRDREARLAAKAAARQADTDATEPAAEATPATTK
jgi:large subunit ribosomal protein L32